MEYFIDYLLFFSKFVSVVVTIAILIVAAVIIIMRTKSAHEGHIEIRNLVKIYCHEVSHNGAYFVTETYIFVSLGSKIGADC